MRADTFERAVLQRDRPHRFEEILPDFARRPSLGPKLRRREDHANGDNQAGGDSEQDSHHDRPL